MILAEFRSPSRIPASWSVLWVDVFYFLFTCSTTFWADIPEDASLLTLMNFGASDNSSIQVLQMMVVGI